MCGRLGFSYSSVIVGGEETPRGDVLERRAGWQWVWICSTTVQRKEIAVIERLDCVHLGSKRGEQETKGREEEDEAEARCVARGEHLGVLLLLVPSWTGVIWIERGKRSLSEGGRR